MWRYIPYSMYDSKSVYYRLNTVLSYNKHINLLNDSNDNYVFALFDLFRLKFEANIMVSIGSIRAFKARHKINERGSSLYVSQNPVDFLVRSEGLSEIIN